MSSVVAAAPEAIAPITHFAACVRTEASRDNLRSQYKSHQNVTVVSGDVVASLKAADVVILAVDPSQVQDVLKSPGVGQALAEKLVISLVAGWTCDRIHAVLRMVATSSKAPFIIKVLPNTAASVGESISAVETPGPQGAEATTVEQYVELTNKIFSQVGQTVEIPTSYMDAFTAVGGSTPAFFAVLLEGMEDAAVAIGLPRATARQILAQSMAGTAAMVKAGASPAAIKDRNTSSEGCTIGGLMVLEEGAARGVVGKAIRESVTIVRHMDSSPHVNDTRRS